MSTPEWASHAQRTIYYWGRFVVENNRFTYEYWMPVSGGGFPTYVFEGQGVNDTTIQLERPRHSQSRKWESYNKVFHMKKIEKKPDSTNRFTK